mmetsp:Transcript_2538/g.6045  ORF Transcript_2538/g.6045 Transcript_2538/m.6045 type:complete len:167 (+) Transcript_2538:111-611(+)
MGCRTHPSINSSWGAKIPALPEAGLLLLMLGGTAILYKCAWGAKPVHELDGTSSQGVPPTSITIVPQILLGTSHSVQVRMYKGDSCALYEELLSEMRLDYLACHAARTWPRKGHFGRAALQLPSEKQMFVTSGRIPSSIRKNTTVRNELREADCQDMHTGVQPERS